MVFRFARVLVVVLALTTAGWPQSAAAAIRVTFYSHGWGIGPLGQTIYPHAFIRLEGNPYGGAEFDMTYGFHVRSAVDAMKGYRGFVAPTGKRYLADSQANFWLEISDAQFTALMARVAWWHSPEGSWYHLRTRTCIDFVADMATTLGLKPGNPRTLKPAAFMKETYQLNADVVRLPDASKPVLPETAPPPPDQPAGRLPDEPGPTPGDRAPGALRTAATASRGMR